MSDKKISVSIVTPEEHVYDGEVNFISIPAKSGSLGILPGHLYHTGQIYSSDRN
jgi:F0F1-type ATP synthase epsilon subunit